MLACGGRETLAVCIAKRARFGLSGGNLTPGALRILQMHRHADISLACDELGYRPTSIREAAREAHEFFRQSGYF